MTLGVSSLRSRISTSITRPKSSRLLSALALAPSITKLRYQRHIALVTSIAITHIISLVTYHITKYRSLRVLALSYRITTLRYQHHFAFGDQHCYHPAL